MRKIFLRQVVVGVLACSLITPLFGARASSKIIPSGSASDVIALVNQLRKANGLPPYQTNNALMAAAQKHSDYQASISTVTHTGPGGSRPADRAKAAGYGGGANIFVSENIMGGTNLSPQQAVQWWQGDTPHLNTMLSPNYQDVGVGVGVSGGVVYYTMNAGYVSGAPAPQQTPTTPADGTSPTATTGPTAAVIMPVQVATPRPDGSIVHVVEPGQALWNIAAAYQVDLQDLLALNTLTENSIIFPGDKLTIRSADTTPTSTDSPPDVSASAASSTNEPRPSSSPSAKPRAQMVSTSTVSPASGTPHSFSPTPATTASSTPVDGSQASSDRDGDNLLVIIAVLVFVGTALVLAGSVLKRTV